MSATATVRETSAAHAGVLETLSACPLCASTQVKRLCRAWDRESAQRDPIYEYARCGGCGVAFESIRPRAEDAGSHYPDSYAPYHSHEHENDKSGAFVALLARVPRLGNKLVDALWRDAWKRRSKSLLAPPRPGAVVLDFGCGSPQYLDKARARGWRTIGVDFSASVVERVRASGHEAHIVGSDAWNAIPDASLDLVRMNHVVEHLYAPRDVLRQLARKLAPGGRIHIATPNGAALGLSVFKEAWFPLQCPLHVVLYDAAALRRVLEDAALSVSDIGHETAGKSIARSIGFRFVDRGWTSHEKALRLGENPLVRELLHVPAKFLAALGRADTVHAVAVKR